MNRFLHRVELRIAVIVALAILVAQLGALAHAYSHDTSAAHQSGALASHGVCADCLAYAPVLSGTGAQNALPQLESRLPNQPAITAAYSRVASSPLLAFRSRAPPETLLVS